MANRIELWGSVAESPQLRTTPAGTTVLRLTVDCGEQPGELVLPVMMVGAKANAFGASLTHGSKVIVRGALQAALRRGRSGIAQSTLEILAGEIVPAEEPSAAQEDPARGVYKRLRE
jgi:primosomal replication protein N